MPALKKVAAVLMPPGGRRRAGSPIAAAAAWRRLHTLAGIRLEERGWPRVLGRRVRRDAMSADGTPVLIHDDAGADDKRRQSRLRHAGTRCDFARCRSRRTRIRLFAEAAAAVPRTRSARQRRDRRRPDIELATAADVVARQAADLWRGAAVQLLVVLFGRSRALAWRRDGRVSGGVLFEAPPRDWRESPSAAGARLSDADLDARRLAEARAGLTCVVTR